MSDPRRAQKVQFFIILNIVFFGFLGISMPYLIFPPLFLNLDYSILPSVWDESTRALLLGVTLAAYPLGQFIGSPLLGGLSDEYGRKKLLSGSLFLAGLCNLLTGLALAKQNVEWLIVSRFFAGFMEGNIAIARAICSDLKSLPKHSTFGKMNASMSIAYLIGPAAGALLTSNALFEGLNASTPFYFVCILFFCLSCLSALLIKDSAPGLKSQTVWERLNLIKRTAHILRNKNLKILLIASTCFTLAVDIFYQFSPVYLTLKWTLDPVKLIHFNIVLCIGLAIGNGWLPLFLSSRTSNRRSVPVAMLAYSLLLFGIVSANSNLFMLVLFTLSGLAIGAAVTLLTVKISDTASDQVQGEVLGTQLSLRVLGDGIICLLGGALLIISPKLILLIASALSLGAMLYYLRTRAE